MNRSKRIPVLLILSATALMALGSACNSTSNNTLASLSGSVSKDASGDLWATLSANLSVTDYGLAELDAPVIDPKNPSIEYGSIAITPVVCSGSSSCANGGLVTLSLNLTAISHVTSTGANLPNNTPFPVVFTSPSTTLVAVPVGSHGAKVYVAVGGGEYFLGTAIPFSGLNNAGQYTPGLDVFSTNFFDNNLIKAYFGYFAGSAPQQTGIGLFADFSALVAGAAPAPSPSPSSGSVASPVEPGSQLINPSNGSEQEQELFMYHLWKLGHDEHPVLKY